MKLMGVCRINKVHECIEFQYSIYPGTVQTKNSAENPVWFLNKLWTELWLSWSNRYDMSHETFYVYSYGCKA